ncbi:hypothetical protein HN011_003109, partial [Eciton burchellii]
MNSAEISSLPHRDGFETNSDEQRERRRSASHERDEIGISDRRQSISDKERVRDGRRRRGRSLDRDLDYAGASRIAKILPIPKKGGHTDRNGMREGSGNVADV